jgi:hypothetical protein
MLRVEQCINLLRCFCLKNGKNAMHWAAEFGHLSTLKILSEHFAVWTDVDKVRINLVITKACWISEVTLWIM